MKTKTVITSISIIIIILLPFVAFACGYRNFFTVAGMIIVALVLYLMYRTRDVKQYLPPEELQNYTTEEIALYYKTIRDLQKEVAGKTTPKYKKRLFGLIWNGEYAKAIEQLETDAADAQEAVDRHVFKAKLCIADCRFKEAEVFYRKSVTIAPSVDNFTNAAMFYYELRKYKEAKRCYENCLELDMPDPERALILYHLGMVYSEVRQMSEAKTIYKEALILMRELAVEAPEIFAVRLMHVLDHLGEIYRHTKEFDKAKECHTEALTMHRELAAVAAENANRELARSLNNLGCVHLAMSEFDKAEDYLTEALEMRRFPLEEPPNDANFELTETLHNLGNLYVAIENYTKAEECFSECINESRVMTEKYPLIWQPYLVKNLLNSSVFYVQCIADKAKALSYAEEALSLIEGCKETSELRELRDLAKKTRRKLEYS